MATSDFVPYATQAGALVEAQASYVADPQTALGQQNGIADPSNANKAWRQGTVMAAAWAAVIVARLGINVPDDGNLANLTGFLENLLASWNIAIYLTSGGVQQVSINGGSFTTTGASTFPAPPSGIARVRGWGAGGGSGGCSGSTPNGAAGGAGGEYAEGVFTGLASATAITIGLPGVAGSSTGPTNGGAGGTTSFGALMTMFGGAGGLAENSGFQPTIAAGGTGGAGGNFRMPGGNSQVPFALPSSAVFTGRGGSSWGCGENYYIASSLAEPGIAGTFPGQGASAAANTDNGAAGASGYLIVEY